MHIQALEKTGTSVCMLRIALALAIAFVTGTASRAQKPASGLTFYRNIQPILEKHCQSCHRAGEIGPVPLVTYQQVRPLARAIADSVGSRRMPPWFADSP